MNCAVDGCKNLVALRRNGTPKHRGLCHAHAKRVVRKKPLDSPLRTYGADTLQEAALALAEANTAANSDKEWGRLWRRIRETARRYANRVRRNVRQRGESNRRG